MNEDQVFDEVAGRRLSDDGCPNFPADDATPGAGGGDSGVPEPPSFLPRGGGSLSQLPPGRLDSILAGMKARERDPVKKVAWDLWVMEALERTRSSNPDS